MSHLSRKEIQLNQKAMTAVLERLASAGVINGSFFDEADPRGLRVTWTKTGGKLIAEYRGALDTLGEFSERDVNMLNTLLLQGAGKLFDGTSD